jgi:2-keto-4-pentenoate hydratase/2-oxohepta-3-ene-1,7-dioic acid hydratase in catechol pathway
MTATPAGATVDTQGHLVKLLTFSHGDLSHVGALADDGVVDVTSRAPHLSSVRTILERDALDEVRSLIDGQAADHALADVRLEVVIPDPQKIVCAGVNYRAHRDEAGRSENAHPTLFTRFADSQIAAGAPAVRPREVERFDYEGELAVVIGTGGSRIPEADAMAHVAGYACYNDFTARDWQRHSTQWTPGKNFPGSGAFGPVFVTADEIDDLEAVKLETRVNGETRQSAHLSDLIFSVPALIAYISTFTPLNPGDVIVSGTPGGVGNFREPPVFLDEGDVVEVEISGVGLLRNVVSVES